MTAIADWLEQNWDHAEHAIAEHMQHRPQPTFTPHEQPVPPVRAIPSQQSQQSQPEEPMPLTDELTALTALATRLDNLGGDSVTKLETVKANPDGSRGFEAIAALSARGPLSPAASAMVLALEALAQQPQ